MTDKMLAVGQAVTRFLIESFDQDYLSFVFSEEMGIDELVDQVLLELSKYAFDETQEKHSIRYYLNQQGNYNEDVRKRYSRLIKISNKYKEKEISFFETNFGMFGDDNRPPQMDEMDDRLEGYHLSPMNFYEITNIGDLELIKAIINHRMGSTKKVSNTRFKEIALQYDKFVLSLREQCQDSDEKMVFNSLAYFTLEWKYAFDFIYSCAESMEQKGITDAIDIFSKVGILIGYIATDSILGITASADSRMVGYREKMIPSFIEAPALSRRYIEILTLMCMVKEKACINDIPIKKWFIDNTDVHDWASFFKDYDVFRLTRGKKQYSNQIIRNMRELMKLVFPENPENRPYTPSEKDDTLWVHQMKEEFPMVKIECYIEEYVNGKGALCARLREKENNRHVIIQGGGQIKAHLLRFLSAAKEYSETMPTVFDRDGNDIVAVRGIVEKEDDTEIEVSLNAIGAGYLFE